VVTALDELAHVAGHIVPEIVKAKLVVGSKCDIRGIGLAAAFAVGAVLVDAVHG
jgi:uncharacterized protein YifN (PemK superfamily)